MGVTAFLIAAFLVLLILHIHFQRQRRLFAIEHQASCSVHSFGNLKQQLKSGDIIAYSSDFSYNINYPAYLLMNMLQFYRYPSCLSTHYAMVLKIDEEVFVYHLTSDIAYHAIEKKYVDRRCVVEDAHRQLGLYPGFCVLYSCPDWLNRLIKPHELITKRIKLSTNALHWIFNIGCQLNLVEKVPDRLTCYEHMWLTLNRILGGAIPQPEIPKTLCNTYLEARLRDLEYRKAGLIRNHYYDSIIRDTDGSTR